jgi:hypothetical protein
MLRLQARADALLPLDGQAGVGGYGVHLVVKKSRTRKLLHNRAKSARGKRDGEF